MKQYLDYGVVGNCKTSALIKKNSSVEWMCFPTFSSPSVFGKILDEKKGGHLCIKTVGKYSIEQKYIPNTAVLETIFTSKRASFKIVDFFPRYRRLIKKKHEGLVRQNRLIRLIIPLKGIPKIKIEYSPAPNYALKTCELSDEDDNLVCKGNDRDLSLISNVSKERILNKEVIKLKRTLYVIVGKKDDPSCFNVRRCKQLMNATKKYWEKWVDGLMLPEKHRDLIIRSAITLKLMTYSETGAIIAASTTSIPEEIGSERTWDYRYCWIRDSAFCADALKKIGRNYETKKLLEFIFEQAMSNKHMQIMYGINGEKKLEECKLEHLDGFKDSKPVRIGNAAHSQIQYDICGEVIDTLYLYFVYYEYEKKMKQKYWRFLRYLVNDIKKNWTKKDNGIWEFRGRQEHFVFSKLMCYVGVDRAIRIAQHFGKNELANKWLGLRDEIKETILKKGWNEKKKAFTMFYGSDTLDASILQMTYHEFLDPSDPRIISTVKTIYNRLRKDYMVQRYRMEDDFGKSKSSFTICSFWLVNALYTIGEEEKARELFEKLIKKSNHLGLFSEGIDMKTKKLVGNFPQVYTHIALINSAILLSEWSAKRKKIDWSVVQPKKWF